MNRLPLLLLALLLLSGCAAPAGPHPGLSAAPSAGPVISPSPLLAREIDRIVAEGLPPQTVAAVKVVSLRSGVPLYERNPRLLLVPASNLKLYTAAAALSLFRPERPVATTVLRGGSGGHDLYLVGGGDALLSTGDLRRLAAGVRAGPAPPAGGYRLVGDVSSFDGEYWGRGWMWDDEPDPDEMFLTPLSVNGNAVTVQVRPGATAGAPAVVTVIPATPVVTVRNGARTGGEGTAATVVISRRPGDRENLVEVSGSIPAGAPPVVKRLSIWRPEALALALFRDLLEAEGVPVSGTAFGTAPPAAEAVASVSHSVGELVTRALRQSDNLAAESLLRLLGQAATGGAGSAAAGVAAVRQYLEKGGIPSADLVMADGSGVSRYNLTTVDTIVRLLVEVQQDPVAGPPFLEALAVAGRSGTLAGRLTGTPAVGRVRGKSGTLTGVSALSGYVMAADGEQLAFAILIQHFTGPADRAVAVQDALCTLLSRFRSGAEGE